MAGTTTKKRGRKLLIASVGVAAVSYVACDGSRAVDERQPRRSSSGGRGRPTRSSDADAAPEDSGNTMDVVANLIAPPIDASADGADK